MSSHHRDRSYWIVQVEGEEMRWQGARSAFTERFEIVQEAEKFRVV